MQRRGEGQAQDFRHERAGAANWTPRSPVGQACAQCADYRIARRFVERPRVVHA